MKAYKEIYLDDAMRNLGTAFDFAKNSYEISMDDFYNMFLNSGIAGEFEKGSVKYVTGMSGIELVLEVLKDYGWYKYKKDYIDYGYSCEYWCGWILAYFQWYHAIGFRQLNYYLKMSELEKLYPTLHEASEKKALEVIGEYIFNKKLQCILQYLRKANHMSQSELSELSGVSLRMIQQYEQKRKDINKAGVNTLMALSRVLSCDIEDIIEHDFRI